MSKLKFSYLFVLVGFIQFAKPSRILFLSPVASKSHKNVFDPLIDALAERGHDLVVISPFKTTKLPAKVHEIISADANTIKEIMKDAFTIRKQGRLNAMNSFNFSGLINMCGEMYEKPGVEELLKDNYPGFDLIFLNGFGNHCSLGLVWYFQAPHILITTMPAPSVIADFVGNHFPSSFVPEPFLPLSHRMSFFERVLNFVVANMSLILGKVWVYPEMERIYKKRFPEAAGIPEMDRNTTMIFMNSHFSMTYPRPLLPSVIEVGGMHCRPGKPLPTELDNFLSSAPNGFILFSLGSIVKAHNMPESTRKTFLNVFGRLKERGVRVLWKWETEEMPGVNVPENVKLIKWVPQQDVLAHKNIKMFITHGGLLSSQESVYHGIPQIALPFFADQDMNAHKAEQSGYSLTLEILEITEGALEQAINEVLSNSSYKEKAKSLSAIYRDQPQTPLEKAVYWTEYVIRHKGARHLASAGKDLNIFQYHSLDVVLFLLVVLTGSIWIMKKIVWNLLIKTVLLRIFISSCNSKLTNKVKTS